MEKAPRQRSLFIPCPLTGGLLLLTVMISIHLQSRLSPEAVESARPTPSNWTRLTPALIDNQHSAVDIRKSLHGRQNIEDWQVDQLDALLVGDYDWWFPRGAGGREARTVCPRCDELGTNVRERPRTGKGRRRGYKREKRRTLVLQADTNKHGRLISLLWCHGCCQTSEDTRTLLDSRGLTFQALYRQRTVFPLDHAKQYLREQATKGLVPAVEILSQIPILGNGRPDFSVRTLREAKKLLKQELGIKSVKTKDGSWSWSFSQALPERTSPATTIF